MAFLTALLAMLCLSCQEDPAGLRRAVVSPLEIAPYQVIDDASGCARFVIQANPGASPTLQTQYVTGGCKTSNVKLIQDTTASFDATTGTLRIPIVLKNVGSVAVRVPARIHYLADSTKLYDANQAVINTPTDILGVGDSASVNGRVAFFIYDTLLAANGQMQLLQPGATSRRRWLEFQGTDWDKRVTLTLFASGIPDPVVPAVAPDSIPRGLWGANSVHTPPPGGGFPYLKNHLIVGFKLGTSLAEKARILSSIGATVIGGYADPASQGGKYLLRLPADSSQLSLQRAEATLEVESAVRIVLRHIVADLGTTH